jgi:hypothetical protein
VITAAGRPVPLLILLLPLAVAGCGCGGATRTAFTGVKPPQIDTTTDLLSVLNTRQHEALSRPTRWIALVTTPFKRLGVFGWTDLGIAGAVRGSVLAVSTSTDGFATVDMSVDTLWAGTDVLVPRARFIRAEVCGARVGREAMAGLRSGVQLRVSGRFVWDGDGHLEIHPGRPADVEYTWRVEARLR